MKRDLPRVVVFLLGLLAASVAGWLVLGHPEWIASMAVVTAMLAIALLWIYRRIPRLLRGLYRAQQFQTWQQIQSLLSLSSVLHITHPLPPMRGAAILPDLANVLLSLILERKPGLDSKFEQHLT